MKELIEVTIKDYLMKNLNISVYMERPDAKQQLKQFILLERLGTSTNNHIKSISLAVQTYSTSMYETAMLNEQVKEVFEKMIELPRISKIKLDSDYPFTDTITKKYRYQAVYDIVHY